MRKIVLIVLVLSPIVVTLISNIFFKTPVSTHEKKLEAYFGKRVVDNETYLRGQVINIDKSGRVLKLRTMGDNTESVFVEKNAQFILSLRISKGADVKNYEGDYFSNIKNGDLVDMTLLDNKPFTNKIMIYDLESFSF